MQRKNNRNELNTRSQDSIRRRLWARLNDLLHRNPVHPCKAHSGFESLESRLLLSSALHGRHARKAIHVATVAAAELIPAGPEIIVSGNGVDIANGDATPGLVDGTSFGLMPVGNAAAAQFFTIKNVGDAPLVVGTPTLPAGFTLINAPATLIDPGGNAAFKVQLDTTVAGTFSGNVSFSNNDGDGGDGVESPYVFAISGTVTPERPAGPEIIVSGNGVNIPNGISNPNLIDGTSFGLTPLGSAGPVQFFTIKNVGDLPLTVGTVTVPAGFLIINAPVGSIAPGAQGAFKVQLDTTVAGTFSGNVSFSNNDGDGGDGVESPYVFAISGTVTPERPAGPEIIVSGNGVNIPNGISNPNLIDGTSFGLTPLGSAGPVQFFTIKNVGDLPLTVGTVTVPAGFLIINAPVGSIAPGAQGAFKVQLDTTVAGTFSGNVSFSNNDGDGGDGVESPYVFAISGTVTPERPAGPEIIVSGNGVNIPNGISNPNLIDGTSFGLTPLGSAGPVQFFTIKNVGDLPLTVGTVTVPAGFLIINAPVGSIAPGAQGAFKVQLDTTVAGTFSGNVSFSNNDGDGGDGVESPYVFAISGTVTPERPAGPEIIVSGNGVNIPNGISNPNLIDGTSFGLTPLGSAGPVQFFTIKNVGDLPLTVGTVTVPAGFLIINAPVGSIAPGAQGAFKVQLDTTVAGTFSGNVSFSNNDGDGGDGVESPYTFAISGTVTPTPPQPPPATKGGKDIGFWHNKNGQALILSFNGGPNSTALGNWLAATFPRRYGGASGAVNLAGKTNRQIAAYFQTLFDMHGPKKDAKFLADALNIYASDPSLSG